MPAPLPSKSGPNAQRDEELRALIKRVRQVELRTRRAVSSAGSGAWHSRFKGRGMAFSESRTYVPGDDPRHVDWNVTARTGELHVKQFVEERELVLLLAVDVSGSQAFGSARARKRQLAAEAAALLAFSALRNNDQVGLLLFSDVTERMVPPRKGKGHVLRIVREILACEPTSKKTDLNHALSTVTHLSRRRAIVALLTDLVDSGADGEHPSFGRANVLDSIEKNLKVCAQRHDLMVCELEDPLERALPNVGLLQVRDAETGALTLVDTSSPRARALYQERTNKERDAMRARLKRLGVDHVALQTQHDPGQALVKFLRQRARRIAA